MSQSLGNLVAPPHWISAGEQTALWDPDMRHHRGRPKGAGGLLSPDLVFLRSAPHFALQVTGQKTPPLQ